MSTETQPVALKFRPGLYRQSTRYGEEGGWYDCDRVRFRDGKPENMRGRTRYSNAALMGTGRAILSWTQLDGNNNVAVGTECRLYLNQGTANYDITPIRASVAYTSVANTSVGSTLVLVSAANHGCADGDHILVSSATTIGGNVFLSGEYTVSVINSNSYYVTYVSAAAATSAAAGNFSVDYELACGLSITMAGIGWGTGTWGTGTWGTPRTSGIQLYLRTWSLDKWGEDLIANVRSGGIYVWDATNGASTRAVLISAAPTICGSVLITEEQRHMMALGCTDDSGVFDPNLVRWSDTENYNSWIATVSNAAGDFRIASGSQIVGGLRSKGQIIIWTDVNAHACRFVGQPFIFSFQDLADNCGLVGQHAAIDSAGVVYWMSTNNFFKYDGAVRQIPCAIQKDIFKDINLTQRLKIFCGSNSEFNEVIWLYCSASSDEIDRYAVYNYKDDCWYWGSTTLTTWDDSYVFGNILGTIPDSYIWNVEPVDVYTDDGGVYDSYIQSADFDAGDGDFLMFADRFVPDFRLSTGGQVTFQVQGKVWPNDTSYVTKGPYNVSSATRFVRTRLRAREMNIRIGCSVTATAWGIGNLRMDIGKDGQR